MSQADSSCPKYGEVWLIAVPEKQSEEATTTAETYPAVVVSSDAMGTMPCRLVACIDLSLKVESLWRVEIPEQQSSGVEKRAVVDAMQLHCVDLEHCVQRIGRLPADCMAEVAAAIAIVVEYEDSN